MTAGPTSTFCTTFFCPGPLLQAGGNAASSVADQAASSVLEQINSGIQQAANWLVGHVLDLIQSSTRPDLSAGWFTHELALMEQVSLLVVLPVLMVATVGPVLRQDARRLARIWGVGLPVAILTGIAAAQLTSLGLDITDAMCSVMLGAHWQGLAQQYSSAMTATLGSGDPLFVGMILSVLTVMGAVLVWLELVVRSAGVYVATFFMPLALVGYIWPATVGVAKRAVEILVSLLLSKFVIVAALGLGLSALAGGGTDAVLSGSAVLLIAAFAPFALLRLTPIVEASAVAHLEGLSRRPGRAAARTATAVAQAPAHPVTQLLMSAAGGAGSAGSNRDAVMAGRVVGPVTVPEATPDYLWARPGTGTGIDRGAAKRAGDRTGPGPAEAPHD